MSTSSSSTDGPLAASRDESIGRTLLTIVLGLFLSLSVALWLRGVREKSAYYIPGGFLGAAAAAYLVKGKLKANAGLVLLTLAPLPWAADFATGTLLKGQLAREEATRKEFARRAGIEYDGRSPKQVVEDLRAQGQDAWPAVHPGVVLSRPAGGGLRSAVSAANGEELLPLGGIAGVVTEFGNEDGRYLLYRSDEHGFRNPAGIWSLPALDVAAVGDSFTQGASVPDGDHVVDIVRQRWPATLNLGYGGNGPLIEYASLLEYLPKRAPRVVLWILCEGNDIGEDTMRELGSPLLNRYRREKRGVQQLEARQAEIDRGLKAFVEARRSAPAAAVPAYPTVGLEVLRKVGYELFRPAPDRWDVFGEILLDARDAVAAWKGQLYLVYLPTDAHEGWLRRRQRGAPEQRKARAVGIAEALSVPVIDVDAVFKKDPNVQQYNYPMRGHYTAAGYRRAGRAIVEQLQRAGFSGEPGTRR